MFLFQYDSYEKLINTITTKYDAENQLKEFLNFKNVSQLCQKYLKKLNLNLTTLTTHKYYQKLVYICHIIMLTSKLKTNPKIPLLNFIHF